MKFGQIQNGGDVKDSDSEKVKDSKPHNLIAHCSKTFAEAVSFLSAKLDTSLSTNFQVFPILNASTPAIKLAASNKQIAKPNEMILLKSAADGPISTFSSDQWCKIKKSLSTALNDVEVCLLRLNTSSNTICINMTDLPNKVKAESKITEWDSGALGLTLSPQKKFARANCEPNFSGGSRDGMWK